MKKLPSFFDLPFQWALAHPKKVFWLFALGSLAGLLCLRGIPLDAIPDLSDSQILFSARVPGSPDQVSVKATAPFMEKLQTLPGVEAVRGFSDIGYGYVTVVLKEGAPPVPVREAASAIAGDLFKSTGIQWKSSGDASGVGWVYEYALGTGTSGLDLYQLRRLQEEVLQPALSGLAGVAEAAPIGGKTERVEIIVNPYLLQGLGLTAADLISVLSDPVTALSGRMACSGQRDIQLAFAGEAPRGDGGAKLFLPHGPLETPQDLLALPLRVKGRTLRLEQVATVSRQTDIRRGLADLDGRQEVVGGVVVARRGVNALELIGRIKAELEAQKAFLPAGVEVTTVYDRGDLIRESLGTISREMIQELLLLALIVFIFLRHGPSALVLGLAFPAALLIYFIPLRLSGLSLNLMTLGGLAIALGDLLDAGIVLVENAHRRLAQLGPGAGEKARQAQLKKSFAPLARPLFFTLLIVVVSFLPVLALNGQAGRLFGPLAVSKTLSMLAALGVTLLLIPALCVRFLKGKFQKESQNPLSKKLQALYRPSLAWVLERPRTALAVNAALLVLTIPLFLGLPRTFLPPLNEGDLLFMPITSGGIAQEEAYHWLRETDEKIKQFPEVERVFGKAGRAESPTDPAPLSMIESTIHLKPARQWRGGMTRDKIVSELDGTLRFPGVSNSWTQPIRGRIDMQATGIRTPYGMKVSAPTLRRAQSAALILEKVLTGLPGVKSAAADQMAQAPAFDVKVDPAAAKKAGLTEAQILGQLLAYEGESALGSTHAGKGGVPVVIRYPEEFYDTVEKMRRFPICLPNHQLIPLWKLARVQLGLAPDMVPLEGGQPTLYVYLDLDVKDPAGWMETQGPALRQAIAADPGARLELSGQYSAQRQARRRLWFLVPLCGLLIAGLLGLALRSWKEAGLVMLSVPYALVGGVWIQTLLRIPLSVSAWVGYIALFAVAVQTGVVMVVYLQEAVKARGPRGPRTEAALRSAVMEGSVLRLRPKLMTAATNVIAFLPLLWTQGPGDDLLASIAAPLVGGMITSAIHVLYITPVLFYLMGRKNLPVLKRSKGPRKLLDKRFNFDFHSKRFKWIERGIQNIEGIRF